MWNGYMGRILDVDLTAETVKTVPLDADTASKYIGGKGLGTRIVYDEVPAGTDPLAPENVIVFAAGPVTGTLALNSVRFNVSAASPLTGGIGNSSCGGSFGMKMKQAGFDAVLIRGKARKPVYLDIESGEGSIKDAGHLWGKGTYETESLLPRKAGKAVIGPAGENLVRFAAVASDERVAGRTGMGAVMGSKNLKAVVARGKSEIAAAKEEQFKEYRKKSNSLLRSHPMTGDILPRFGTAKLVRTTNARGILPTRNFQTGTFDDADKISGEWLADNLLEKNGGCFGCPIKCGRVVKRNGVLVKGPEYETIGELGSNLLNPDMGLIIELNYLCDDLGMDTISAGGVLGFAMELTEKGLLKSDLAFGKTGNLAKALEDIAHRRDLGDDMAEGVRRMSEKFGGGDFAIHVKGLELPAYDPRGCWGQGLEYCTTGRGGCHVNGTMMFFEATGPIGINPHSIKSKPELTVMQQNLFAALNSLTVCAFSSYAVLPPLVYNMNPHGLTAKIIRGVLLNSGPFIRFSLKNKSPLKLMWYERFLSLITGDNWSMGRLDECGERIFNLERLFNLREGFTAADDNLPARMLNESIHQGVNGGVPISKMIGKYYEIRGWDENGVPTEKTLDRFQIER